MAKAEPPTKKIKVASNYTDVRFRVRCNLVEEQDVVCVLGDKPELGGWDQVHAVSMTCISKNDEESQWEVTVRLLECSPIEYKYVIRRGGEVILWETIIGNRTLTPGAVNFALGKPCEQSSTYVAPGPPVPGPRNADIAVSGNTNGYNESLCSHTNKELQPWWQVDLGVEIPISNIVLWNRQDRCVDRLFPVWIMISKQPFGTCDLAAAKSLSVETRRFEDITRISEWNCNDTLGRYVRVQLENENFLHFSQLEVYHRVDLQCQDAKRFYYFADESNPDFQPDNDPRDHFLLQNKSTACVHEVDDGLLGLDSREVSAQNKFSLMVDDGWLSPQSGSEVRIILGSISGKDSVYLIKPRPVAAVLRVQRDENIHWPIPSEQVFLANTNADDISTEDTEVRTKSSDKSKQAEFHKPMSFLQNVKVTRSAMHRNNSVDYLPGTSQSDPPSLCSLPPPTAVVLSYKNLRKIPAFGDLSDAELDTICATMERVDYEAGDILIQKGEIRKYVYIIENGYVEVVGQNTLLGERVLGGFGKGKAFGQMALLAGGYRTSNVRASSKTTCYRLHRDSFKKILGKKKYYRVIEKLLKASDNIPTSSSILKWHRNTCTAQEVNNPDDKTALLPNDIQVFRVRLKALEHHSSRFMLDVYASDEKKELLGTVFLLPSQMYRSTDVLSCPIISMTEAQEGRNPIIGQVHLRYVIINPLVHPNNNLSHVFRNHWRTKETLDVGHRGMGRSFHQVEGYRKAAIPENTLMSFIVAGQSGADYIEFDVQLTKDRVPVVYHDFHVEVGLEDNRPDSKVEHHVTGIHDLTARHLDRCHIEPVQKKTSMFKRLVQKHWSKLVKNPKSTFGKKPSRLDGYLSHLVDMFPRLKHVLEFVPENIGLNIEIKYPIQSYDNELRDLPVFEMNSFLDTILKCVFDKAQNRRIIFSCFDPDVCTMLRAKQARYPVFFLTSAGTDQDFYDTRCLSIESALLFSKMERIQGIVSNSDPFFDNPELITAIKREGLILFTWGDKNTDHAAVQFQKKYGVDAVISDNVGDLTKRDNKVLKKRYSS